MTDAEKLALFDWVSLNGRRLNFGLIGGRVALAFGGARPPGSVVVDRLDAVVHELEGVTADRQTLAVGALGIATIAEHLATIATYAQSPKALHDRLFDLFAGSAFAPEMIRATVQVACDHPGNGEDESYFIEAARRQLKSWSADGVSVTVR